MSVWVLLPKLIIIIPNGFDYKMDVTIGYSTYKILCGHISMNPNNHLVDVIAGNINSHELHYLDPSVAIVTRQIFHPQCQSSKRGPWPFPTEFSHMQIIILPKLQNLLIHLSIKSLATVVLPLHGTMVTF